jgi:hypothetical protein
VELNVTALGLHEAVLRLESSLNGTQYGSLVHVVKSFDSRKEFCVPIQLGILQRNE